MSEQLGIGVMIQMMGGNEDTVNAVNAALNKTITNIRLRADGEDDDLIIELANAPGLKVWDGGQSCCESRYMTCDDDLEQFIGAELLSFTIEDAPEKSNDYEVHEVQFLRVKTSKGTFTVETHNEHNGYYGGFYLQAAPLETI